jgi:hypothetical protein
MIRDGRLHALKLGRRTLVLRAERRRVLNSLPPVNGTIAA